MVEEVISPDIFICRAQYPFCDMYIKCGQFINLAMIAAVKEQLSSAKSIWTLVTHRCCEGAGRARKIGQWGDSTADHRRYCVHGRAGFEKVARPKPELWRFKCTQNAVYPVVCEASKHVSFGHKVDDKSQDRLRMSRTGEETA